MAFGASGGNGRGAQFKTLARGGASEKGKKENGASEKNLKNQIRCILKIKRMR